MIPDQRQNAFLAHISQCDTHARGLAQNARAGWELFWSNPSEERIEQFEAAAREGQMTPKEVFEMHGASIAFLTVTKPERITWFPGATPIEVPWTPDGLIDRPEFASRWQAYLATLPPEDAGEEDDGEPEQNPEDAP